MNIYLFDLYERISKNDLNKHQFQDLDNMKHSIIKFHSNKCG